MVCNATNLLACISTNIQRHVDDGSGTQVPTVLDWTLTGVRGTAASAITVTMARRL